MNRLRALLTGTASVARKFLPYCLQSKACILVALLVTAALAPARAQQVTQAQAKSGKYQAYQAWLRGSNSLLQYSPADQSDSLSQYAAKCDAATGIQVPSFSCGNGVEVPGQGTRPWIPDMGIKCDRPNVLNNQCDPGSKFQVLPGRSADAVAVAHCRKVGLSVQDTQYNDIAVIQYNKKNGALCFYQALGGGP